MLTACNSSWPIRTASRSTKPPASRTSSNPICDRCNNRSLSLFDATHRIVASYYLGIAGSANISGFKGKALNGWAVSGITTLPDRLPDPHHVERIIELMNSFDFELPGKPDRLKPFKTLIRRKTAITTSIRIFTFTEDSRASTPASGSHRAMRPARSAADRESATLTISVQKNIPVGENKHFEFRAELFNVFNHTQFPIPTAISATDRRFRSGQARPRSAPWCSLL